MKEFTKAQYIRFLLEKRKTNNKRRNLAVISSILLLGIGLLGLFPLVKLNFLHIPPEAQEYLLSTSFYKFSQTDLEKILTQTNSISLLPALLAVYWGYYICVFTYVLPINYYQIFTKTYFKPYEKGLIAIYQIREIVQDTPKTLTYQQKKKVREEFKSGEICKNLLPLQKNWISKLEYEWLASSLIGQDIGYIVFGLPLLESALLGNMANFPKDLSPFMDALSNLERFYIKIACKTEKDRLLIIDLEPETETVTTLRLLLEFSERTRPMVMRSLDEKKEIQRQGLIQKTGDFFQSILQNDVVKQAGSISGIGAFIMFIGVSIFKIDTAQAFLTWFTITFGTLSISIGLNSKKKSEKENPELDSE